MNTAMKLGIAALSLNALIAAGIAARSQQLITAGGAPSVTWGTSSYSVASNTYISSGFVLTMPDPPPNGAIFHQVVDRFYDADGNVVDTRSYTHAVNGDCHNGVRRQEDAIAQDDGKGNVRFVATRLANEPATGVKPLSAEAKAIIKAFAAIKPAGDSEHDDHRLASASR